MTTENYKLASPLISDIARLKDAIDAMNSQNGNRTLLERLLEIENHTAWGIDLYEMRLAASTQLQTLLQLKEGELEKL